jgi:hypothetical protein
MTAEFKPTDEEYKLVESMTAVGIPQADVALVLRDGIDVKTLRKHFRRELDTAKIKANAKIGGTLFSKAIGGDTTSAIFWAKTQMGWKETNVLETVRKEVSDKPRMEMDEWQKKFTLGNQPQGHNTH